MFEGVSATFPERIEPGSFWSVDLNIDLQNGQSQNGDTY